MKTRKSKSILVIVAIILVIFAALKIKSLITGMLYNDDLIHAAKYGRLEEVKHFIRKGANVNAYDDTTGFSVLMIAALNHHLDTVKFLIKNRADVNATAIGELAGITALRIASAQGDVDIVKILIENGANVNAVTNNNHSKGETALMAASGGGHLDVVKLLVENGADVNAVSTKNYTALKIASEQKHSEIVKYLIDNGANNTFEGTSDVEEPLNKIEIPIGNIKGRGL